MLNITKAAIRNIAADEQTYARGIRYYQNGAVKNITWSQANKQYRAFVKGQSDYIVTVTQDKEDSFNYSCNCPASFKYSGPCKHVIATLLFVADYENRKKAKASISPDEKNVFNIIDYFSRQDEINLPGETFNIKVCIYVPAIMKSDTGKAYLSIQVGSNRFYKVQSLKKFISDYYNKEDIVLGKEFRYIQGESKFHETSQKVMDFLVEVYEVQELLGRVNNANVFSKSQMVLTKYLLMKLLSLLGKDAFHLNLYGNEYRDVRFYFKNPRIEYQIDLEEEALIMNQLSDDGVVPVTQSGELLFFHHAMYQPNPKFIKNFVPFFSSISKEKGPLYFTGTNKHKFLEYVLPQIHQTMEIQVPEEIKNRYIDEPLRTEIYLDKYKSNIRADIKFYYGEYKINPLHESSHPEAIIVRKPMEEDIVIDYLSGIGFEANRDYFIIKKEEEAYEFLTEKLDDLISKYEVFYSEAFRMINIRNVGNLNTNLKVKSESDLLEMQFEFEDIPAEELKDLFNSYRLKKKYYRLKNGDFINLQTMNMEKAANLLERMNVSYKDLKDSNAILLPKNTALYLNQVLEEEDSIHADVNDEFRELVNQIMNPKENQYDVPANVNASLRSYQVTGFKWLCTLADNNLGGILADDMGLGKTLQSIVYMAANKERPYLIVCPSSLIYNWQEEIEKFAPFLKTAIVIGTPEERAAIINSVKDEMNIDVVITSYPLIRRDIEVYGGIQFHTMFIDEAQFIKNANSRNAKSVKAIHAKHKFALTGTPIENSLSELWSIFDFVMPFYLFTSSKFQSVYEKPIIREGNEEALADLNRHIQPFILRRMKKEVLSELPDKVETKYMTEMTDNQRKLYAAYMSSIRDDLFGSAENGFEKKKIEILAALTRLRQICCHPSTFVEDYKGGSGKMDLLMEILPDIIGAGHRVLIFSQFTSMLHLIEEELKKSDFTYFSLEGSTSIETRKEQVKRFNDGERDIFLISLKAGGTGLNLVGADTVIHFDPWWNPAVEEQATDRVYRIGQKNSVQVIKLITKDTIEEKIYKLQKKKKELSDSVIQSKEIFISHLSREELEEIFK
ncbi:DEAD/DEAH box helicase [Anaerosporobacter sp.]|uniref:DEAD/DEAH box helicase n=1 Tax=Anaerosporobacter sp. TaxID=1872529 RepID=UPI00286EC04B|nr:DEAD/DEAH box helicase [Anaerosporobacter sp.]